MKQLLSAYFLVLFSGFLPAQNPVFHRINDENGLPSNEVYSIMQDHHGFIWFGCDAGLYRYNGVKFIQYQNVGQRSAAITGLTLSGDSVIYCYNFSNQIFFVQGDSLHELKSWQGKSDKGFTNITVDAKNRLWASSPKYLYCFNRQLQSFPATSSLAYVTLKKLSALARIVFVIVSYHHAAQAGSICNYEYYCSRWQLYLIW